MTCKDITLREVFLHRRGFFKGGTRAGGRARAAACTKWRKGAVMGGADGTGGRILRARRRGRDVCARGGGWGAKICSAVHEGCREEARARAPTGIRGEGRGGRRARRAAAGDRLAGCDGSWVGERDRRREQAGRPREGKSTTRSNQIWELGRGGFAQKGERGRAAGRRKSCALPRRGRRREIRGGLGRDGDGWRGEEVQPAPTHVGAGAAGSRRRAADRLQRPTRYRIR